MSSAVDQFAEMFDVAIPEEVERRPRKVHSVESPVLVAPVRVSHAELDFEWFTALEVIHHYLVPVLRFSLEAFAGDRSLWFRRGMIPLVGQIETDGVADVVWRVFRDLADG